MNDMKKPVAVPEIGIEPDAALIAICAEHVKNIDAYTASTFQGGFEDDPLWHAYERTRDAIDDAKPTTIVGIVAKARAAKAEALQPDGSEHPSNCPAEGFAWDIVNDLLRLDAIPNPDAELIRLCDRNVQLERLLDEEYSDGRDIPPNGPIMAEINGNMEQISTIPATTLEGLKASAKAIDTYAPDLKSADLGGPAKKMVAAMLRDLTGEVQV